MPEHVPVMSAEVLQALAPQRGGLFVDCTVGLGGHAAALLDAGAERLIGIDRDREALAVARTRLEPWGHRADLVHADYRDLAAVLQARGVELVSGILADLGVSSLQLEGEGRGFSFQRDEPLDMRMDRSTGPTAADLVAALDEEELANLIFRFGEERYSRRIARAIVETRRVEAVATTGQLAAIVKRAVPRKGYSPIHPATRTFQALRIRVNGELDGLDRFVDDAARHLAPGGRLVVIAFHSLEDRVIKHRFREMAKDEGRPLRLLARKAAQPTDVEVAKNPRSRSAKLRAIERTA
jgi:16S rRNA (cytosine1402-N4)-methyltransferase